VGACSTIRGVAILATVLSIYLMSASATPLAPGDSTMLTLSSSAFSMNGPIPMQYTCEGAGTSPPLAWAGVPEGTKSLVLLVDDPDAPGRTFTHWVVYDMPPTTRGLPEAVTKGDLPSGAQLGKNDYERESYGPPCPPRGRHRYFHKLYALDVVLKEPSGRSQADIERAMRGHVLAETQLVGTYQKQK
jgi:Raf kinase inhibitor-like YbhB/YbcL family protein